MSESILGAGTVGDSDSLQPWSVHNQKEELTNKCPQYGEFSPSVMRLEQRDAFPGDALGLGRTWRMNLGFPADRGWGCLVCLGNLDELCVLETQDSWHKYAFGLGWIRHWIESKSEKKKKRKKETVVEFSEGSQHHKWKVSSSSLNSIVLPETSQRSWCLNVSHWKVP